ncbi:hypothetical protein [Cognatilysobacter bugurensis]|uniref:Uncharacterized protein n=1 Tax=Cognatilysobacter bugurensis TaxID=543356 RepID=A0A918T2C3_9GAMM|nr:hypothetical protein [Lysobacter bugurensis]GHA87740.1 hypothetical protein GCM10007067_27220 [Lysobacter bugurensis]
MPILRLTTVAALCLLAALAGCERTAAPAPAPPRPVAPPGPVAAVEQRLRELRRNDLDVYARHAVPPTLYAQLERAWREDRTRWPLTELPLDDRLPGALAALAEPGAERRLRAAYRREFAGARTELRSAVDTLGVLGERHLMSEPGYGETERAHYLQLAGALQSWGRSAALADARRANPAIERLVSAARRTRLAGPHAMRDAGLDASLRRLGPFFGAVKDVFADYGFDLDAALADARVEPVEQRGDRARVRLRYTLAGRAIDTPLDLQRIDGRWYLTDTLAHARLEADRPAP